MQQEFELYQNLAADLGRTGRSLAVTVAQDEVDAPLQKIHSKMENLQDYANVR